MEAVMQGRVSCAASFLAWGIAGALLPFASLGLAANEMEHVHKQMLTMQAIEALHDPETTGSISGSVTMVWIDVMRPTMCKLRMRDVAGLSTSLTPVSSC